MVPSSYLRVYQPLDSFDPKERERWLAYVESGAKVPRAFSYRDVAFAHGGNTGIMYPALAEHAYAKKRNGTWFVCPWRIRLRVLVGLLAFRNSLPVDLADHFVPEFEAEKAVEELEALRSDQPEMRANIATAPWHVPLRWFVAFEDAERCYSREDERSRISYETDIANARTRGRRGLRILETSGLPVAVVDLVRELGDWVDDFPSESLLELDYGGVADLFTSDELEGDRSAGEVWACLEALELGDLDESNRRYSDLVAWWSRVQALQAAN